MGIAMLHWEREKYRSKINRQPTGASIIALLIAYWALTFTVMAYFLSSDEGYSGTNRDTFFSAGFVLVAATMAYMALTTNHEIRKCHAKLKNISMRLAIYERILDEKLDRVSEDTGTQSRSTLQRFMRRCQAGFRSLTRGTR